MVSRKISYAREGSFVASPFVSASLYLFLHPTSATWIGQGYIFIGYYMHILLLCIHFSQPLHFRLFFLLHREFRNLTLFLFLFLLLLCFHHLSSLFNPVTCNSYTRKLSEDGMFFFRSLTDYSQGKYNGAQLVPNIETLFREFVRLYR